MAYIDLARCSTFKGGILPNFQGWKMQRSRKLETVDTFAFIFIPKPNPLKMKDNKLYIRNLKKRKYRNNIIFGLN